MPFYLFYAYYACSYKKLCMTTTGAPCMVWFFDPGSTGLLLTRISEKTPFLGYKGPRELTEKKIVKNVKRFCDTYYNTGDLLRADEDGYLYFVDRIGDTFR